MNKRDAFFKTSGRKLYAPTPKPDFFITCHSNPLNMKYILTLFLLCSHHCLQAQFGESLKDSVEKYEKKKQYKKVLPFAEQWAEKLKKDKKESSAEYGSALNSLGNALNRSGKRKEAEPILLQGMEIRKKALGPEHPDVAASLNSLGTLYYQMGEYTKAQPY
jgi:tetratricopeptide (TPR) repeat protein